MATNGGIMKYILLHVRNNFILNSGLINSDQ
jgi:hypothetical protein